MYVWVTLNCFFKLTTRNEYTTSDVRWHYMQGSNGLDIIGSPTPSLQRTAIPRGDPGYGSRRAVNRHYGCKTSLEETSCIAVAVDHY